MSSVLCGSRRLRRMCALALAGFLLLPALGCSSGGSEPEVQVAKAPGASRSKKGKKKAAAPKKGVVIPITARDGEFDYPAWAELERPLAMPDAVQKGPKALVQNWQKKQRTELERRVAFPYTGAIEVKPEGKARTVDQHERQEFSVTVDGKLAFRYFRLTPKSKALGQRGASKPAVAAKTSAAPDDKPVKRPTVLAFMSHGKVVDLLENEASDDRAAASELADAGYLVFAMESAGMAAKDGPLTHRALDDALRLNGSSWYGLVLTHAGILLDQVAKDPEVDTKRIGAMGTSTGGMLALTLAAMDPRVTAVSAQGASGSWHSVYAHNYRAEKNPKVPRHHCRCGLSARLLPDFDVPELAAMVAPRPLHLTRDEGEAADSPADRVLAKIGPVFDKFGEKPTVDVVPKSRYLLADNADKFFRAAFELPLPEGPAKADAEPAPNGDKNKEKAKGTAEPSGAPAAKPPSPPAVKAAQPAASGEL